MRNKLIYRLTVFLVALSIFTGCSFQLGGIRGSGVFKTESREVTTFSSISFKSVGKLKIQQNGKESLTISAEDNILPILESRVSDQILYISNANESSINPTKPIEFVVEVKSLESLNIDGVGSIEANGIQGKRLSVSLDGVGSVAIAGNVDVLDLSLSGVGSFQGGELKTNQATVRNKGVGSAVVNVSDRLDATVSGIGSIEYIGFPQVKESVKGMGAIKKR
ncbi:Putative auto-transporter adhesin head GIN domain-containing protein [Tumidithrix helvetica PCC 7403]|uniref:GIN domain-containing protein n=1 Tax=Tumidithrix helvetica TaxID=3457545 RepID=UPI003CA510F0